ncbi:MAG: phosphate signaling complex protein PhoU [Syntrophomonadaceae bacterium]|nr:phosphate signaling complex protein PhoU [Syntrophomonadaceae bacterium]
MIRKSFHQDLEELKEEVLKMGTLVEAAICRAVKSLAERDIELARRVVEEDDLVDNLQLAIEDRCFAMLALQQPMAGDLRTIGTALKIVTDLERIGDHAVDIAQVTIALQGQPLIKPLIDIPRMARLAQRMVRDVLSAYVNRDVKLAYGLRPLETEVDHLYQQVFRELLLIMMENPTTIRQATHLLFVAMYLERVADHATNVAEWVIYMVLGRRMDINDCPPGETKE